MRRATEQLAVAAGPAIGGLLNVSFGSAAELILALFVLLGEHAEIVRAQINGSIIGTSLLDLGLACFTGGVSRNNMSFSRARAGNLSSLLLIVVFALLLLAVFDQADVAHAATVNQRIASEGALSIGVAVCAELVSGSLESAARMLHLPLLFVGVVLLALVGTAADLFAGVSFARQGRMNLVMSIFISSALQVGLVIAPLLVLISWAMGMPMSLVFPSVINLFVITGAAFLANAVAADGHTSWFKGLLLIGAYVLLAIAFFEMTPARVGISRSGLDDRTNRQTLLMAGGISWT
jgi:Ca2+:H+ antiporter